ncbi:probable cytochrome P450 6a14 isoform X2 [Aphidius gifuensis]|uniref:probable cytochrome P450 6a14 isoform X2 n=1 Tax=Aphidius gifuensis TaxID=684658 RepID=UPI001CDCFF4B|nr:probable cytochrome P450 6a14 isoform X2 [Aphidius gifuensis]
MTGLLTSWFFIKFIISIGIGIAGIYMYFKKILYLYWEKRGVSYVEPTVPFGNLTQHLIGKISVGELYENTYEKYKKYRYFGMYTFHKPSLVINDPDLIRIVMTKNFQNFHDRGMYCNEKIDPLSGHLFSLPGSKWKNLRVKLTPTFTSGKMKQMFGTICQSTDRLIDYVKKYSDNHQVVEMKDITARLTTDVISSIVFGLESNCLDNPNSDFRIWGKKTFEPNLIKNSLAFFGPQILNILKIPFTDPGVSKFFTKAFEDSYNYRVENNIQRSDFMNLLMQLINKGHLDDDNNKNFHISESTDGKITMNDAIAQAFVFFLAGYETTSTTIILTLYELSRDCNKHLQEKLRYDIDNILNKHNGKLTYEAIQEMTYLHKVTSETLRKYPPVPILNRVCTKDIDLPETDLKISKGLDIVIPVIGLHHDPDIYPDPEAFDPERFNEANTASRHPYTYLPFGEGPRSCIGIRFGLIQAKIVLTSLLVKYKFSFGPNTPYPLEIDPGVILLTTKTGVDLKIEPR